MTARRGGHASPPEPVTELPQVPDGNCDCGLYEHATDGHYGPMEVA